MEGLACGACATPTVPGARFCFHCGTPVERPTDPAAERRVVTVLFGDLSDFTAWAEDLDPERVGIVTDRLLASLANAVTAFGGSVDKLTGDGIMAVFGAPTAHEDDPERAVRAAAQMQDEVGRLVAEESGGGRQLGLRVGINTGEVLAGYVGGVSYTVVGDAVNTASRLSDAAGVGEVLAGRDTALSTLAVGSWRAVQPLRLKGKRDPVPAYELIALRPGSATRLGLGDEAPLTGREAELGLLVSRVRDAVESRSPTTVVLTGDAGVGKTRLWHELVRKVAGIPSSRVLVGRCAPHGRGRDLAPLVEMIRTASGIGDDSEPADARARVRRLVSRLEHPARVGAGGVSAESLLVLLGLDDAAEDPLREGAAPGPASRGEELAASLAGVFTGLAAEGPLILLVDDLQWAGRGLLDLLAAVGSRLRGPIAMVAVGRQELMVRHAEWSPQLPDVTFLPLGPLETAAADRLLRAYLGGADLDDGARQMLLDRAQGNPFFLAELLHLLVDRGLLRREGESWVVTADLPAGVLPAGVQAVLAARIDAVPPDARAVLRDAAVVGTSFPTAALVALRGGDEEAARAQLAVLADHGIVQPHGADAWAFAHALTRDVAYSGVAKSDRARKHAQLAAWAVGGLPGTPAEVDVVVAAHAELAVGAAAEMGMPRADRAWSAAEHGVRALLRLGQSALARDDSRSGLGLLRRAVELVTHVDDERLEHAARLSLAAGLARTHQLDEALAAVEQIARSPHLAHRAAALVVIGEVHRKRGDEAAATRSLVQALTAGSDAGDDRTVAEALRQLGLLDFFAGRLRDAEERFRQALDLARRVGDGRGTGWALQHLAWSATTRGDYELADETLADAAAAFRALDDRAGLAWCAGTEALVRVLQGRLADSRRLVADLLPISRGSGHRWSTAACLTIDALAAGELGELPLAAERGAEARAIFVELGDSWGEALAQVAAGLVARARGEGDVAVAALAQAASAAERFRHRAVESLARMLLAWSHYEAARLDEAEAEVRRSLELASDSGLGAGAATGEQVLLALIARARGDVAGALRTLDAVALEAGASTLLFPLRQAVAHRAATLLEAGQVDAALAEARRAVDVDAEDVRSAVVAHRVRAAVLVACGRRDEAEADLRTAVVLARDAGYLRELTVTEVALAALGADARA